VGVTAFAPRDIDLPLTLKFVLHPGNDIPPDDHFTGFCKVGDEFDVPVCRGKAVTVALVDRPERCVEFRPWKSERQSQEIPGVVELVPSSAHKAVIKGIESHEREFSLPELTSRSLRPSRETSSDPNVSRASSANSSISQASLPHSLSPRRETSAPPSFSPTRSASAYHTQQSMSSLPEESERADVEEPLHVHVPLLELRVTFAPSDNTRQAQTLELGPSSSHSPRIAVISQPGVGAVISQPGVGQQPPPPPAPPPIAYDIFFSFRHEESMNEAKELQAMIERTRPDVRCFRSGDNPNGSDPGKIISDALADAISKLIQDKNLCEAMGSAGRDLALREYNFEKYATAWEDCYREVVFQHRSAAN
jgi:hypothetical protein